MVGADACGATTAEPVPDRALGKTRVRAAAAVIMISASVVLSWRLLLLCYDGLSRRHFALRPLRTVSRPQALGAEDSRLLLSPLSPSSLRLAVVCCLLFYSCMLGWWSRTRRMGTRRSLSVHDIVRAAIAVRVGPLFSCNVPGRGGSDVFYLLQVTPMCDSFISRLYSINIVYSLFLCGSAAFAML